MSSKNVNKKSDDKAEQEALKEAEIVAESAPNEKIRKEAEELIGTVETRLNFIAQDSSEIFGAISKACWKLLKKYLNSNHNMQKQFQNYSKNTYNW